MDRLLAIGETEKVLRVSNADNMGKGRKQVIEAA
jgi:hypothetical protein